jgi:proteasome lid subunit RPN8/RPN11
LSTDIQTILRDAASANYKKEICGLITERGKIWPIANVHESPRANFFFDKDNFIEAVDGIAFQKDKIIGIWHTHPNGQPWPSPRDLVGWPNPALGWRYWIATPKEVLEWKLVGK